MQVDGGFTKISSLEMELAEAKAKATIEQLRSVALAEEVDRLKQAVAKELLKS